MTTPPPPLDAAPITFRPLGATDLPLLDRWLRNPAVARWWDVPSDYAAVVAKYTPRTEGRSPTRPFLILHAGTPVGYIQTHRPAAYPDYAAAIGAGPDAASIDVFIGEDGYRWRGVGSRAIRAFLRAIVFADPAVTHCLIDPHPDNVVALRAYERAGFRHLRRVADDGSGNPCVVLRIERAAVLP